MCINCDSVIDKELLHNNIEYLEYNKNTNNGTKIMNDLNEAQKLRENAEKKLEEYNEIIEDSKREAKKIIENNKVN